MQCKLNISIIRAEALLGQTCEASILQGKFNRIEIDNRETIINAWFACYNNFMVDVHCHLNFHAFEKDYDEVIKKAKDTGVEKIINVGTSIESSQKAVALSQKYDNLYAIVGIHPHHADKLESEWEKEIEKLARQPKVVAIGEVGIDYFSYKSNGVVDAKLQKQVFIKQIEIAQKLKLPLQIHSRKSAEDIIDVLSFYKNGFLNPPGMFHCMAGNIDYLKKILDLGFYVGFDGNITYKGFAPGEDTKLN